MVLDQPGGPLGDRSGQALQRRGDVVVRINRLADVVQQGGQEEFLIIRPGFAGEGKDLKAMKECIALGMISGVLLDVMQWHQTHLVQGESFDMVAHPTWSAARLGLRSVLGLEAGEGRLIASQDEHLLADLGVAGQIARPDLPPQHGRRLSLRAVELGLARLTETFRALLGPDP